MKTSRTPRIVATIKHRLIYLEDFPGRPTIISDKIIDHNYKGQRTHRYLR